MKSCSAFILTFLYLLGVVQPIVPWAGYQLNKSFIATALCENADRPVLQCDGKCYLRKQVTQQETESPQPQQTLTEAEEVPVSLLTDEVEVLLSNEADSHHLKNVRLPGTPSLTAVFHPPTV